MSASFSDPNLVSCAGLLSVLALAGRVGLSGLADEHLSEQLHIAEPVLTARSRFGPRALA